MKVILSEIKKNLQRINSGVDEAENQSNDLEYKIEINSIRTARRKKNPKKYEDRVRVQKYQHLNHRGARRRIKKSRNGKLI